MSTISIEYVSRYFYQLFGLSGDVEDDVQVQRGVQPSIVLTMTTHTDIHSGRVHVSIRKQIESS